MTAGLAEIDGAAATRFGILLDAAERGNRALVADMLVSIPVSDLLAIEQRLAAFDIDLSDLVPAARQRVTR